MRLIKTLMASLLLGCLLTPATALAMETTDTFILDQVDALSDSEEAELNSLSKEISDNYGVGVYTFVIDDFSKYAYSVEEASEAIYKANHLDELYDGNMVMLLLSMEDRDFDLSAHGDRGNYAFTDYGKNALANSFLPHFTNNGWYKGIKAYISTCGDYMALAKDGNPVDVKTDNLNYIKIGRFRTTPFMAFIIFLIAPGVIALIGCSSMFIGLKSVKKATTAGNYVTQGGVKITRRNDHIINTRQHRVHIEPPRQNHSGGGDGTTINSGGFSHHSGKF